MRQPIIAILGHVDSGKTSLLDSIRKTAVAAKEAGGITQQIGTTEVPASAIKEVCGDLLEKFRFDIKIPGLLFIDTPGHEAFTTLRKRGGSIADLAILVIDINEGVMPQTEESIKILKDAKTPFVVAINKIDRIHGWKGGKIFLDNYSKQSDIVKGEFEKKFYDILEHLRKFGFESDRFDRVTDFSKTVAAVPLSAKTEEGIPDLLVTIIGLAQTFLKEQLVKTDVSEGMILEVKDIKGLGHVIDCIIYNGTVRKNDYVAIGGKMMRIAKIKALLMPAPMRDIRAEKKFMSQDECNAACGVRISAAGLENVVAGSSIMTAPSLEEAQNLLDAMEKDVEEIEIHKELDGLVLKASTIGGLEALINIFKNYPIEEASIGPVTKEEIIVAQDNKNRYQRVIIGFNTDVSDEAAQMAREKDIKIITSEVIYHLIEGYEKWLQETEKEVEEKEISLLNRPGKMKILPGLIFRASNPAIVGCEIISGIVKPGTSLFLSDMKNAGEVKQIQSQGQNVDEAKKGDKVAVSIKGPTVGRQINENDILYTDISSDNYKRLLENKKFLSKDELSTLEEIAEIKKKQDPRYGL